MFSPTSKVPPEEFQYQIFIKTAIELLKEKSTDPVKINFKATVAIEQLTKAIEMFPDRSSAYSIRAKFYSLLNKKAEEETDLKKSEALKIKSQTKENLEKSLSKNSPSLTAVKLVGSPSIEVEHIQSLRRQHENLIKFSQKKSEDFEEAKAITSVYHTQQGIEAIFKKPPAHTVAIDFFTLALAACPYNTTALFGRASSYKALEKYDEGIQDCSAILEILCPTERDDNLHALRLRAFLFIVKDKDLYIKEAYADLIKMMTLDPAGLIFDYKAPDTPRLSRTRSARLTHPDMMSIFSFMKFFEKKHLTIIQDARIKQLTQAIIDSPFDFKKLLARADLLKDEERRSDYAIAAWLCGNGIASYDAKILPSEIFYRARNHSQDLGALITYNEMFMACNNVDAAKKTQNRKEFFHDLLNRGKEKLYGEVDTLELPSEAIPYFTEAIDVYPEDEKSRAHVLRGLAYRKLAKYEAAIKDFEYAALKNPQNKKAQALLEMTRKMMQGIFEFPEEVIVDAKQPTKQRKKKKKSPLCSSRLFSQPGHKAHSPPQAIFLKKENEFSPQELLEKSKEDFKKSQEEQLKKEEERRAARNARAHQRRNAKHENLLQLKQEKETAKETSKEDAKNLDKKKSTLTEKKSLAKTNIPSTPSEIMRKEPDILLIAADVKIICIDRFSWTWLKKLNSLHKTAYLRGGVVRKTLQGIPLSRHDEVDLITDQPDEFIQAAFENMEMQIRSYPNNRHFYKIYSPWGIIEIWRVPDLQLTYEDTKNGDFKDSAVYARLIDEESCNVQAFSNIPHYLTFLESDSKIQTIVPAKESFKHCIRILRALYRSAKLKKNLSLEVEEAIVENSHLLSRVKIENPSYLNSQIFKIFSSGYAESVFNLLLDFHIFQHLFSEKIEQSLLSEAIWLRNELREMDLELKKIDDQLDSIKNILSNSSQLTLEQYTMLTCARTELLETDEHRKNFLLHRIYALFIICHHVKERMPFATIKNEHCLFEVNFQRTIGSFNAILQAAIGRWNRAHPSNVFPVTHAMPTQLQFFSHRRQRNFWDFCPDFKLEAMEQKMQTAPRRLR